MEWLERHQLPRMRWIGRTNRYFQREGLLVDDCTGNGIREKDVALYVAGSSVLHAVDGWSYAGRALESLSRGDAATATHLGYYASLRAAMSLLATEGIGIFNTRHVAILPPPWSAAPPSVISRGTHVIAWFALEHWATYVRSGDLIGKIISPFRIPLSDWLGSRPGNQWRPVARDWLLDWGADLRQLARDRDLRNRASYRPHSDHPSAVSPHHEFVAEVWRLCEPAGGSVFQALDIELLRRSLEVGFQARHGRPAIGDAQFAEEVQQALEDNGQDGNAQLRNTLLRTGGLTDSPLIELAGVSSHVGSATAHLEVISRALLLLRLATGSTAELLRDAGIDRKSVEFWWLELLDARGIWDGGITPSLDELWDDLADALDDVRAAAAAKPPVSAVDWLTGNAASHARLVGLERIAVGGLLF
ncbi:hypothetical protein [Microbacterium sp.]|uniref:hypothetical protein n=1 Tax=Microbacterium sp. TaxID=51671 RepID=UPI0031FE93A3|nr:hypothetical protein [Microbacterium sp.]